MAFFNDDISINSLIGAGSKITGNIKINGFVRIDGDLDGNLETPGSVIIGENARILGNVTAKSVTVGGIVQGSILAPEYIKLLKTSAVLGDIQTHKLLAEDNVFFNGHCIALNDDIEYEEAVEKFQDSKNFTEESVFKTIHFYHPEKPESLEMEQAASFDNQEQKTTGQ